MGRARRCYSAVRHTMIHQSRKGTHIGGWVANAQAPVYKCERGGARRVRAPQVFQRQFFCLLKRRKSKHPFQGRKYSITVRFTRICLVRLSSCLLTYRLYDDFCVCFSCMLTVRLVLWPENCPRNLISSVFCARPAWPTLRVLWN